MTTRARTLAWLCLATLAAGNSAQAQVVLPAEPTAPVAASEPAPIAAQPAVVDDASATPPVVAAPESSPARAPLARPARVRYRVHPHSTRRPRVEPASSPTWFRGPLAAAYLAPPTALAIDALVADKDAIVLPALLGLVGLSVPPLVHVAHGDTSGAGYSVLGMLAGSGVGALSGLAIGHLAPGDLPRDDAQKRDALIFGFLGYLTWAVLDVGFFAYGHPRGPRFFSATVQPTFAHGGVGHSTRADGLELRVSGAL